MKASRIAIAAVGLILLSKGTYAGWLEEGLNKKRILFDGTNIRKDEDVKEDRRGKVVVRRIKIQNKSDWNSDPTALPYFFYQIRERTKGRFPTYVDNEGLELSSKEVFEYPIILFSSHYPFEFTEDEVKNLKKYLARGGTLWLDDCTGSGPFMDTVPPNVQRIIPGAEFKLMMVGQQEFSDFFDLVYRITRLPVKKEQFMQPFQAVRLKGRVAIIICPNDYACDWEVTAPPTALNPLGHPAHGPNTPTWQAMREEVYQLCINWLFYSLTH